MELMASDEGEGVVQNRPWPTYPKKLMLVARLTGILEAVVPNRSERPTTSSSYRTEYLQSGSRSYAFCCMWRPLS